MKSELCTRGRTRQDEGVWWQRRLGLLHSLYARSSWWGWLVSQGVRPFGWGVATLALLSAILGTDVLRSANHMVFCVAVACLLVSFCWIWTRKVRFRAERKLPEFACVGEELSYALTLFHEGKRRVHSAFIEEWPADSRPSRQQFIAEAEPGEESRNAVDRFFLYYRWTYLCDENQQFSPFGQALRQAIEPNSSEVLTLILKPSRRGRIRLANLRALLPDPLGLFQRSVPIPQEEGSLYVLPHRIPLARYRLPQAPALESTLVAAQQRAGQSEDFRQDFRHLRDYRPGDPPRTIAWKTWARTGEPFVREFEPEGHLHHTLIFDDSSGSRPCFEAALSLVTSLLLDSQEDGSPFGALVLGKEAFTLPGDAAMPPEVLRHLAGLEQGEVLDWRALRLAVAQQEVRSSTLLLVVAEWTSEHEQWTEKLRAGGHLVRVLVVGDKQQSPRAGGAIFFLRRTHLQGDFARFAEQSMEAGLL